MTPAHVRFLLIEAIVGAVFGGAFGVLFFFVFFGGMTMVPVYGGGLIADAAPQTFMTSLFAGLFPTFLTRRKLRTGRVASVAGFDRAPRSGIVRVVLIALGMTVLGVALWAALLSLGPAKLPFGPVLALKTLYGVVIGAGVAAAAARVALGDDVA